MDKCNFGMRDNCRAWLVVKNGRPAGEQAMAVGEEVSLRGPSNSDPERSPAKRTRLSLRTTLLPVAGTGWGILGE
ncbi:hypothetical protein FIBSPDRAFT_872648 [Athelia psychrophila]|uniref:Uncharacterized protein n=1 Tax=Athelia psychrophila TaxID=1759441 RepID=A0A165Z8Y6_9AGAM|nr:hypothetical protein FIBSPDRAFT_872648 [Fibularhizoctonia sp. CBS 109695]